MKISKIELKNWRGFFGDTSIKFSTDDQKKVNLIIAENGTGKSNLMEAIYWCLYGDMPDSAAEPERKLTTEAEIRRQKALVRLTVEDSRSNKTYILQRVLENDDHNNGAGESKAVHYTRDDPTPRDVSSFPVLVDKLLPKHLSNFFLFSGEGVSKYFKPEADSQLKNAIENVQGIAWSKLALTELEDEIEDLEREIRSFQTNNSEVKDALDKLDGLKTERKELKDKEEALKKELNKLKNEYNKISKKIQASDNKKIKQLEKDKEGKKKLIIALNNSVAGYRNQIHESFEKQIFHINAFSIKEPLSEFHQELKAENLIPGSIAKPFVEKILERKTCICGVTFEEGSEEEKNLIEIRDTEAQTEEMEKWRSATFQYIQTFDAENESFKELYSDLNTKIETANGDIETYNLEIEGINLEMKDLDDTDVSDLLNRQSDIEDRQYEISAVDIPGIVNDLSTNKKNIDKAKDIAGREVIDEDDPRYKKVKFLQKSYEILEKHIEELVKDGREKLGECLNDLCTEYSRKGHKFKYRNENSYYPMMLSEKSSREDPANKGDAVMKAIFYASSLIRFCKERFNDEGALIQPGTIAPMVCDAVLSDLDGTNAKSISKVLCETPEQLIIFLNAESFEKGFEKALSETESLGKLYYLQRSVRDQGLDEPIKIFNSEYSPWLYNKDKTFTDVIEIDHG